MIELLKSFPMIDLLIIVSLLFIAGMLVRWFILSSTMTEEDKRELIEKALSQQPDEVLHALLKDPFESFYVKRICKAVLEQNNVEIK